MLVSVITAVYNGELYLKEAIDSILGQSYTNIEYIIVNDGSTDSTAKILNTYHDNRLKVIHLAHNQGAAYCLNLGIDHAHGELIAIQDADDISLPSRIEEQVNFLLNNSDFIGVASHIKSFQGIYGFNNEGIHFEEYSANRFFSADQILSERFYGCPLIHGSVMYYKNIFYKVEKYNTYYKIAYDYDLWLRMLEIGKIAIIPHPLYQWRVNNTSLSRNKIMETNNEVLKVSTSAILRNYYMRGKNPIIGICGTSNACLNFQQQVSLPFKMNTVYYSLRTKYIKNIHIDFNKKRIDGLIILDNFSNTGESIYHYLSKRVLQPNDTLFKIWNVIN